MASHGRYTIKGKLADGGMAEIFLAVQHGAEGFEKPVVLKRILTQYSADQQFRWRCTRPLASAGRWPTPTPRVGTTNRWVSSTGTSARTTC
jgi:hypothetical protein